MFFICHLHLTSNKLIKNVFPVPAGASRKKIVHLRYLHLVRFFYKLFFVIIQFNSICLKIVRATSRLCPGIIVTNRYQRRCKQRFIYKKNNLFINNKALKFKCLLKNLKCLRSIYRKRKRYHRLLPFTSALIKVK